MKEGKVEELEAGPVGRKGRKRGTKDEGPGLGRVKDEEVEPGIHVRKRGPEEPASAWG